MSTIGSVACTLRWSGLLFCLTAYGCSTEVGGLGSGVDGREENSSTPDGSELDGAAVDPGKGSTPPGKNDPLIPGSDAGVSVPPANDAAIDASNNVLPDPTTDAALPDAPATDAALPDVPVDPDAGAACGTPGAPPCGPGQVCEYPVGTQCETAGQSGVCKKSPPKLCAQVYAPVCGCDGKTYSNACTASSAGVGVQHVGACEPLVTDPQEPTICGGFAGFACAGNTYCNYELAYGGQGCDGIADASGVCLPKIIACTKENAPVCGCDGKTYVNACEAHANEASVARPGACEDKPTSAIATDVECEAAGGIVTYGLGPAAKCSKGTVSTGPIKLVSGAMPIEGVICCLKL